LQHGSIDGSMKFFVDNPLDNYDSVDVRVCAFMYDNVWKTAFLILRFGHESTEQVKNQHKQLFHLKTINFS